MHHFGHAEVEEYERKGRMSPRLVLSGMLLCVILVNSFYKNASQFYCRRGILGSQTFVACLVRGSDKTRPY